MTMILSTHLIYFKLVIKQCWVFCGFATLLVLKWEKNETEKEIHETTKALHREIDISRLYEGMEPNTTYRLVSMVKNQKNKATNVLSYCFLVTVSECVNAGWLYLW